MGTNEMEELNKMFQKSCARISKRKAIEDTPDVMELRRLRDEHYEKAREYQNQIDEAIKAIHNVPDLVDKYIHYTGVDDDFEYYAKVSSVDRLFDGIRVNFSAEIEIINYKSGALTRFTQKGDSIMVQWEKLDDIKIITREEFEKAFDSRVSDFKSSLE